jgi:hypothetical protein
LLFRKPELDTLKGGLQMGPTIKVYEFFTETFKSKFEKFCNDQVAAFKMTPAARECIMSGVAHSALKHVVYGGTEECLLLKFDDFKEFIENNGKILSAGMLIDALAREYAAKHDLKYSQALEIVGRDNPELFNLYVNENARSAQ